MDLKLGTHSERSQNDYRMSQELNQAPLRDPASRDRKGINIGEKFEPIELTDDLNLPRKYLKTFQDLDSVRYVPPLSGSEYTIFMKQEVTSGSIFPRFIPPGQVMDPKSKPDPPIRPRDQSYDISPEEALKILETWRQSEFYGWDHWCKTARAIFKLEVDARPPIYEETTASAHHPSQTLGKYTLSFPRKGMRGDSMQLSGGCIGRNHQECRRDAIQKLFCKLQELGLLKYGLIQAGNFEYKIPVKIKASQAHVSQPSKNENALNKTITTALNEHRFDTALDELRKTMPSKTDSWLEVFQVWAYALLQGNMRQLRQTIDIMQYLKIKNDEHHTAHLPSFADPSMRHNAELLNTLKQNYGFEMVKSDNNFDMTDTNGFLATTNDFEVESPSFDNSSWLDCDLVAQLKIDVQNFEHKLKPAVETPILKPAVGASRTSKPVSKPLSLQKILAPFEMIPYPLKGPAHLEKGIFYVDPIVLSRMYLSLIHSPCLGYAIEACENLHSRIELDRTKLKGPCQQLTADFLMSRLNLLALEMIESVFKTYCSPLWQSKSPTILSGKVTQVSYRNREQIFFFQPVQGDWVSKVLFATASSETFKDHKTWVKNNDRVCNKDFVLLVCFPKDDGTTASNDQSKHSQALQTPPATSGGTFAPMSMYLEEQNRGSSSNYNFRDLLRDPDFIATCCQGKTPKALFVCQVYEITIKNTLVKVSTLCRKEEVQAATKHPHDWSLVRVAIPGHHYRQAQNVCNFSMQREVVEHVDFRTVGALANPGLAGAVDRGTALHGVSRKAVRPECNMFMVNAVLTPPGRRIPRSGEFLQVPPVLAKPAIDSLYQLLISSGHQAKHSEESLKSSLQDGLVLLRCPEVAEKLEFVQKLVERLQGLLPGKRKLISTQNPFEADAILEWLRKNSKVKVKRLITSQYEAECRHLDQTPLVGKFDSYYKNALSCHRGRLADEVPEELIIMTHESLATSYLRKDANFTFDAVILLDASTAVENLLLGPLSKANKLVFLMGDQYSTPFIVNSEIAASKGLRISLFERLLRNGYPYFNLLPKVNSLPQNILKPFLKMFEMGDLHLEADKERGQPEKDIFCWPSPIVKSCFINTKSPEIAMGDSLFNPKEAELAINIALKMVELGKCQVGKMAIVTPYTAQHKLIKACLAQAAKVDIRSARSCSRTSRPGQKDSLDPKPLVWTTSVSSCLVDSPSGKEIWSSSHVSEAILR